MGIDDDFAVQDLLPATCDSLKAILKGPSSPLMTSVLASLPRLVPRYMLLSLSHMRPLARTSSYIFIPLGATPIGFLDRYGDPRIS